MTRPKIAILGSRGYPSYYGGFETLVRHLVPFLIERGWDVVVYCRPGQAERLPESDHIEQVFTPGLTSTALSTLSFGATASAHAAADKPDVTFVMNVANGFYLPMLRLRGIPTVVNVDGIEWIRDKWSPTAKRVFRAGARATARFANFLVSDSVSIAEHWKTNFGRPSEFIAYGAEAPESKNAALVREAVGVEPGTYALLVARFVPENSVNEFLDAASIIAHDHPVVLVGSAPDDDPLMRRTAQLDSTTSNIHALGHVSDDDLLFALWSNAGCYFHGHSVGGTNPALVQAMACGAPTVARDTVFNREVLADNALFVDPVGSEIAASVTRVIEDESLRETLAVGARSRAAEAYTWTKILNAYETLFREALKGQHMNSLSQ